MAPRLPATAAALAAGEIGSGQLPVITETIAALPASVPPLAREWLRDRRATLSLSGLLPTRRRTGPAASHDRDAYRHAEPDR